jgi:hypothetical protein
MEKRIPTRYRHQFKTDGSRRNCYGLLEIICSDVGVYVRCNYCGEGYRFEYVVRKPTQTARAGGEPRPIPPRRLGGG